jgi:hypothetical protein
VGTVPVITRAHSTHGSKAKLNSARGVMFPSLDTAPPMMMIRLASFSTPGLARSASARLVRGPVAKMVISCCAQQMVHTQITGLLVIRTERGTPALRSRAQCLHMCAPWPRYSSSSLAGARAHRRRDQRIDQTRVALGRAEVVAPPRQLARQAAHPILAVDVGRVVESDLSRAVAIARGHPLPRAQFDSCLDESHASHNRENSARAQAAGGWRTAATS